jgi:hypothetical protein
VNPEIQRYIDEHGATYTPQALRKGLVEAGHDPAAVDAALRAWAEAHAGRGAPDGGRTFGRWAVRLHLAALAATFLLLIAIKGVGVAGTALIGVAVLAVALLIGWAISSRIGRALLPRTGVVVALIAPAISALLLGGTCFGLLNVAIPTPPRQGSVHLQIDAPLAFDRSGSASCYVQGTGSVLINSAELGTLDGRIVITQVNVFGSGKANPAGTTDLSISLNPISATTDRSPTSPPRPRSSPLTHLRMG